MGIFYRIRENYHRVGEAYRLVKRNRRLCDEMLDAIALGKRDSDLLEERGKIKRAKEEYGLGRLIASLIGDIFS